MFCQLVIKDEVNVQFVGLNPSHIAYIIDQTKRIVAGSKHTPEYRLGVWDGKESQFQSDGSTFFFMLPVVLPIVEAYGYQISLVDQRRPVATVRERVEAGLLKGFVGFDLRDYQVNAANAALENRAGVIDVATSGGKTLICASTVLTVDPYIRTITIVPSEFLVKQTSADYLKVGLDVGAITGTVTGRKRELAWGKRHIVVTWQTLNNCREYLKYFDGFLFDECHNCGDVMFEIMRKDLAHAWLRIGLSATLPRDPHKREKILCHIGGDVLIKVKPSVLMDAGHISQLGVKMVPVDQDVQIELKDWDQEFGFLNANLPRMRAIGDFILSLPKKNTMVLTHPEFGKQLAAYLNTGFIDKDTPQEERESLLRRYNDETDYMLVASYGTTGTGISVNNILQGVLVDVGKNETRIIQGIGRIARLDDYGLHEAEIFDIYSKLSFSERHKAERIKLYREYKYDYEAISPIRVRQ